MHLYFQQIETLLQIINGNQAIVFGDFNSDFVTPEDKKILLKYGVDFNSLFIKKENTIFNSFNFGMLAESLREVEKSDCTYETLVALVKKGKYIPPTSRHLFLIKCLRIQTFPEIKHFPYFQLIKDEFIQGITDGQPITTVTSDIGHKTKDWGLENILRYYYQVASELSSVMEIKKRNDGKDVLVYKRIHGCCEDCIKLFLTNGIKSQPKIFRLSFLEANESNIGKPRNIWKPTVLPVHFGCECALNEVPEGFIWNNDTQSFSTPYPEWKPTIINRKKIMVRIGDKEFWV